MQVTRVNQVLLEQRVQRATKAHKDQQEVPDRTGLKVPRVKREPKVHKEPLAQPDQPDQRESQETQDLLVPRVMMDQQVALDQAAKR